MLKRILLLMVALMFTATGALAKVKSEVVDYKAPDGQVLEGYIAYDPAAKEKHPGILIVHDWMGISKFTIDKADKLAKEGYVAFAVDIYGKGLNPANPEEAGKLATKFKDNRKLLRSRIRAAYDYLTALKQVDNSKIVVIGYCFGGTTALELARSGVPLVGTVSFHGGLSTPTPDDAKNIKGRVLVMHGADDPHVPPAEVKAFKEEMQKANVDMTFIAYPGAVHAFTNPAAGNDNSKGAAYNETADKASWKEFENFLKQVVK